MLQTPEPQADAIRTLMAQMPAEVGAHFAIAPDGSFTIDTMSLAATV